MKYVFVILLIYTCNQGFGELLIIPGFAEVCFEAKFQMARMLIGSFGFAKVTHSKQISTQLSFVTNSCKMLKSTHGIYSTVCFKLVK